jgi:hypothetical protein
VTTSFRLPTLLSQTSAVLFDTSWRSLRDRRKKIEDDDPRVIAFSVRCPRAILFSEYYPRD